MMKMMPARAPVKTTAQRFAMNDREIANGVQERKAA
jgi:hypothetical protein